MKRLNFPAARIAAAVARCVAGERAAVVAKEIGMSRCAFNYHLRKAGAPKFVEGMLGDRLCPQCGSTFKAKHRQKRPNKYCSSACGNAFAGNARRIRGNLSDGRGYVLVDATPITRPNGKRVVRRMEQIVIAERVLGRRLRRGEVVHHLNGDKGDNRHANLLICDHHYHAMLHARMSYLYQREHFA